MDEYADVLANISGMEQSQPTIGHKKINSRKNKRHGLSNSSFLERVIYVLEKRISASPEAVYSVLSIYFVFLVVVLGVIWYCITTYNEDEEAVDEAGGPILGTGSIWLSFNAVIQMVRPSIPWVFTRNQYMSCAHSLSFFLSF